MTIEPNKYCSDRTLEVLKANLAMPSFAPGKPRKVRFRWFWRWIGSLGRRLYRWADTHLEEWIIEIPPMPKTTGRPVSFSLYGKKDGGE